MSPLGLKGGVRGMICDHLWLGLGFMQLHITFGLNATTGFMEDEFGLKNRLFRMFFFMSDKVFIGITLIETRQLIRNYVERYSCRLHSFEGVCLACIFITHLIKSLLT